jgi:hypothetical protein
MMFAHVALPFCAPCAATAEGLRGAVLLAFLLGAGIGWIAAAWRRRQTKIRVAHEYDGFEVGVG